MASNSYTADAEDRKMKRSIHAPCVYTAWNEYLKKDTEFYPAVGCSYDCKRCGWNPDVAAERIARIKEEMEGGHGMNQILTLCDKCSADLSEGYRLKKLTNATTELKKNCEVCGRKGSPYELSRYLISSKKKGAQ